MTLEKRYTALSIALFMLSGILGIFSSCMKEDTDDCPDPQKSMVRIVVKTLEESSRATMGSYDIENIYIYVFDEEYRFISLWKGDSYTPGKEYEARFESEPGIFHFVVWTNHGETYHTTYSTTKENYMATDLIVSLQYPSDKQITSDITDLHHGILTNAEVVEKQDNEFTIIIKPNIYTLNLSVEGLSPNAHEYSFTVRDNNSHYAFDNSILEDQEEFEYLRTTNFTDDELKASMKVLRLTADRSPRLCFSDETENLILYENDLIEMIGKAYRASGQTVDFDITFEFDILLRFDAQLGVTVSVNGWNYTSNQTEL